MFMFIGFFVFLIVVNIDLMVVIMFGCVCCLSRFIDVDRLEGLMNIVFILLIVVMLVVVLIFVVVLICIVSDMCCVDFCR